MRKDMVVNMCLFTKKGWGTKRRYIYTEKTFTLRKHGCKYIAIFTKSVMLKTKIHWHAIKIWEDMVVNFAIFTKSGMLS